MRMVSLFFLVVMCVAAQQPGKTAPDQTMSIPTDKPDAQLHADVLTLVELEGSRQGMESGLKQLIESGKAEMMKLTPCNQAFAGEWSKRMLARINIDDFMSIRVSAYERHLKDADIRELIVLLKKNGGNPAVTSELRQRLESAMPSIQSEIMGGGTQIGAKLGAEIGQEIQKEHPEYCSQAKTPNR